MPIFLIALQSLMQSKRVQQSFNTATTKLMGAVISIGHIVVIARQHLFSGTLNGREPVDGRPRERGPAKITLSEGHDAAPFVRFSKYSCIMCELYMQWRLSRRSRWTNRPTIYHSVQRELL